MTHNWKPVQNSIILKSGELMTRWKCDKCGMTTYAKNVVPEPDRLDSNGLSCEDRIKLSKQI